MSRCLIGEMAFHMKSVHIKMFNVKFSYENLNLLKSLNDLVPAYLIPCVLEQGSGDDGAGSGIGRKWALGGTTMTAEMSPLPTSMTSSSTSSLASSRI